MSGLPPEQRAGFSPEQNFFQGSEADRNNPMTRVFTGMYRKGISEGAFKNRTVDKPKAPSEPPASAASKGRATSGKRARKHNVRRG